MNKHSLYLQLDVALVEATFPTEETPDDSPKLMLSAQCNGYQFNTPFQAVSAVEGGRDALVVILFEVLGKKLVEELDKLNDLTDRTPKTLGTFERGPDDKEWRKVS